MANFEMTADDYQVFIIEQVAEIEELKPYVDFQSVLTTAQDKSTVMLGEQEAMSTINNQVQAPCIHSIKSEPSSVADLNDNLMLKTENTFCSYTDETHCSQICCVQNSSGETPITMDVHQSNWKHKDVVKLEFSSEYVIGCIKDEQVPGQKLHHIIPEDVAHIEKSDRRHESVVKLEYCSQDFSCLIKTEQDPMHGAKTEQQLVFEQDEQDYSQIVKTETDWPAEHTVWQHDSGETFQEMSAHRCKTPEVVDIKTDIPQHQTHPVFTEDTIDSGTQINSDAKLYQCPICLSSFSFRTQLKKHMMIHTDFKAEQCTPCTVVLERLDIFKQQKVTKSNERPHQCKLCEAEFTYSYHLNRHMLTHSDEKPHLCKLCEAEFKSSLCLKRHMSAHSDVKQYQCNVCREAFKSSGYLKRHKAARSDGKPYQCSLCEALFKLRCQLKAHMVTHSEDRPHQCNLCHKNYKKESDLKKHLVTHYYIKPHQCNVCKAKFDLFYRFIAHMLTHSDERPHLCPYCHNAFKRVRDLTRHIMSVCYS